MNKDKEEEEELSPLKDNILQYEIALANRDSAIMKYIAMIIIAGIAAYWASTGHDGWGWLIFILFFIC